MMENNRNSFYDNISRPSRYVKGRQYEPKDVIRDWDLNFNLGSAVKYISRAGRKGPILEDLRKARQFIDFEIDAIESLEDKIAETADEYDEAPKTVMDIYNSMPPYKRRVLWSALIIMKKKRKILNEVNNWSTSPWSAIIFILKKALPKEEYKILKEFTEDERKVLFILAMNSSHKE